METIRHGLLRTGLAAIIVCGLAAPVASQESQHLCFLTVAKAFNSGHAERKTYVINNRVEWEDLWATIVIGANPKPDLPEIDFTRRALIAVFQGTQPTGGFEITITDIVKNGSNVKVVVKEVLNPHCPATGADTQPLHIVEVGRLDLVSREFKIKQRVRKCN